MATPQEGSIFSWENPDCLPTWYDKIMQEKKDKEDLVKIESIEVIKDVQKIALQPNFIVKTYLSTSFGGNNKLVISIDNKDFIAYTKFSIDNFNTMFADVFVDFSSVVKLEENFKLTVKLINTITNAIIETKFIFVKVNKDGLVSETDEEVVDEVENARVLLTISNFTSIFGNRKLFTHKDMKIYKDVYNLEKQTFVAKLNEFFVPFQINTAIRIAHFLGQIEHESAHLSTTQEFHDGSNYENRIDLGNTKKGDGKRFRGRGLIQLTGRSNYAAYSAYYNNLNANKIDFTVEPNNMLFVSNINFAINVSCWFWINKGLNILADEDDLIFLTYKVNGGFNGYNSRKEITQMSIKKLDVIADEDFIKELGIYTVEKSKLYDNYSGIYKWARYHDEKYPKLEGTGKNKKEAKSAYQRVLYLYENDKTNKTKANLKIYKNAQNRNSIL